MFNITQLIIKVYVVGKALSQLLKSMLPLIFIVMPSKRKSILKKGCGDCIHKTSKDSPETDNDIAVRTKGQGQLAICPIDHTPGDFTAQCHQCTMTPRKIVAFG